MWELISWEVDFVQVDIMSLSCGSWLRRSWSHGKDPLLLLHSTHNFYHLTCEDQSTTSDYISHSMLKYLYVLYQRHCIWNTILLTSNQGTSTQGRIDLREHSSLVRPTKLPGGASGLAWRWGLASANAMLSLISRPHFLQVVWARDCYAHVNLRSLVACSQLAVPWLAS